MSSSQEWNVDLRIVGIVGILIGKMGSGWNYFGTINFFQMGEYKTDLKLIYIWIFFVHLVPAVRGVDQNKNE